MTELSTDEQAIVDRFGIFEPEQREAAIVEEVARALHKEDPTGTACTWPCPTRPDAYRRLAVAAVAAYRATQDGGAEAFAAAVLRAAAQEQRNEAENVPDTDEGTHADGHRCAADFLDRRAARMEPR